MQSISKRVAEDTALKMKYERQLQGKFNSLFRTMAAEAETYYKQYDQPINTNDYDSEIHSLLRSHYRKVSAAFSTQMRDQLIKAYRPRETKKLDDTVQAKLNEFINRRSLEQTYYISKTNNDEMLSAYMQAYYDVSFSGLSKDVIAAQGAQAFATRALGRSKTIGQTETQLIAEASKDIEANAVQINGLIVDSDGEEITVPEIEKIWVAVLDDKTRDSHVEADYQSVPQDDPFIVQGQKLMYPGDSSLGASLDNIINCRCNSIRALEQSGLDDFQS